MLRVCFLNYYIKIMFNNLNTSHFSRFHALLNFSLKEMCTRIRIILIKVEAMLSMNTNLVFDYDIFALLNKVITILQSFFVLIFLNSLALKCLLIFDNTCISLNVIQYCVIFYILWRFYIIMLIFFCQYILLINLFLIISYVSFNCYFWLLYV